MADTQRRRTVVNGRKFTAKQIKAGFGGKRRKAAAKTRHKPRTMPKATTNAPKRRKPAVPKPVQHRRRTTAKRRTTPNIGKIVSFSLPKEFQVATTKRNTARRKSTASHRRRPAKENTGHRRRGSQRNPSMGNITELATGAVFTVAGAVGTQQFTQMVLGSSNTGVMGYFGNLVTAFLLSWGVKAFMKNDRAATAVLAGGFVEIVLRIIADYTPFGSITANLGMGDYLAQNFLVPQRLQPNVRNWTHSAALDTSPNALAVAGMAGCGSGLYGNSGLY